MENESIQESGICLCKHKKNDHKQEGCNNCIECSGFIDKIELNSWGGEIRRRKIINWLNEFWSRKDG